MSLGFTGRFRSRFDFVSSNQKDGANDEQEREEMVPSEALIEVSNGEKAEHQKGYNLLDDFQLDRCELSRAPAVRGHLEAILEKCNQPTDDNRHE